MIGKDLYKAKQEDGPDEELMSLIMKNQYSVSSEQAQFMSNERRICMRRWISLVSAVLLMLGSSGLSIGESADEKPLGHLTKLGVEESFLNEQIRNTSAFEDIPFSEYKFFDTLDSMILALDSGVIDGFITNEYTYEFLRSRNENRYSTFSTDPAHEYSFGFAMLLREEDSELCGRISDVIAEMRADGTMDKLKDQYIDRCIAGEEPAAVQPETFDQAGTLKVALTGDIPPMDYFSAEGLPVGFNTALVSEVGRRLKMNIEFISVNSGARAASLASRESDIVFWTEAANYYNWGEADREDQPDLSVITDIYLPAEIRLVVLKTFPGADP